MSYRQQQENEERRQAMPKVHEMIESKFLKKEDVGTGVLAIISHCDQQNVAMQGAGEELKWCLHFENMDKPLVLNSTNIQLCKSITGSDDTDDWIGKTVVLYTDPNVSYGGKLIGGIRIRAQRVKSQSTTAVAKPKPVPAGNFEDLDDDIPF